MNKKNIGIILIAIIILVAVLYIMGNIKESSSEDSGSFKIVATFYPQYIALLNLTEGANNVKLNILNTQNVGCLHEYTMTTNDMKKLEASDLIVINGASMEQNIISQIDTINKYIVDSSLNIPLIESNGETNSHTFLSIKKYIEQVKNIASELKKLNPVNANIYTQNENNYLIKLNELEVFASTNLNNLKDYKIVTFHSSFDYFALDYGIDVVGYITKEPDEEPSAKQIAEIIDMVKSKNVKSVFAEKEYNLALANTVTNDAGAKLYELDTITGGEFTKDAYILKMKENILTIKEALNNGTVQ